ncbi:MAG: GAF domain-containing protein [Candidatus Hodarchaeota archaeon]
MDNNKKTELYQELIQSIKNKIFTKDKLIEKNIYKTVIDQLATLPHFHWTGIYLLDKESQELNLDYYIGKPTEHIHIPVGKGVCGSAVSDHEDKVIEDVTKEANYLACSLETRSEIVVLIEDNEKIIGQIDVDSDEIGAFNKVDRNYLREIASIIVKGLNN